MTEMEFLRKSLPQSDLDCYDDGLLRQFAEHGAYLRQNVPWCASLEQALFEHYVLCPRVNDEDLSFCGKIFFDALFDRIRDLGSMSQRVLEVNRWCGEMACYQMQDDRTASPLTVYRNGSGRCGEESAFLVAALRSVGIPARQVYAPRWAHCDDNHAWVEAWCEGTWHFLGACEPEPVLDRGWFNTPASRALLVHSRIFGESNSPIHGDFLYREGGVCWYNQTKRYARTRRYRFTVLIYDTAAAGAQVHIQVLNESSFHTIATLTADEQGQTTIELGLDDFHLLATLGDLRAEADCHGEDVILHLEPAVHPTTGWIPFDVHAPHSSKVNPSVLDEKQKKLRGFARETCAMNREQREESFRFFAAAHPQWEDLLLLARGNAQTILAFLNEDDDPNRESLLRTLSPKDLRDVTVEVLNDHLRHAPERGNIPAEIYDRYVLCPRIGFEPLRPWRKILQTELAAFREKPDELWEYLTGRMAAPAERIYEKLRWTPAESWLAGRCNERSRKLLYVAALRSLGTPARLRPLDGTPEYWKNGKFQTVQYEETGTVCLNCVTTPTYRQNWSLSRWTGDCWQLLDFSDVRWKGGKCDLTLPVGTYRLITTQRMPNGNQYAARRDFLISPGKTFCSELYLRSYELADMLGRQELPVMKAQTLDGQEVPVVPEKPSLLLWLEEGAEPTAHLLAELAEYQPKLEALPVEVTVLIRSEDSLKNAQLANFAQHWPGIRVLLDDWYFDVEQVARCMTCDPDTLPLAVVCDGSGQAVFGASGYQVGLGALLTDIAKMMC